MYPSEVENPLGSFQSGEHKKVLLGYITSTLVRDEGDRNSFIYSENKFISLNAN